MTDSEKIEKLGDRIEAVERRFVAYRSAGITLAVSMLAFFAVEFASMPYFVSKELGNVSIDIAIDKIKSAEERADQLLNKEYSSFVFVPNKSNGSIFETPQGTKVEDWNILVSPLGGGFLEGGGSDRDNAFLQFLVGWEAISENQIKVKAINRYRIGQREDHFREGSLKVDLLLVRKP